MKNKATQINKGKESRVNQGWKKVEHNENYDYILWLKKQHPKNTFPIPNTRSQPLV